jgi:hypothetical protein
MLSFASHAASLLEDIRYKETFITYSFKASVLDAHERVNFTLPPF